LNEWDGRPPNKKKKIYLGKSNQQQNNPENEVKKRYKQVFMGAQMPKGKSYETFLAGIKQPKVSGS